MQFKRKIICTALMVLFAAQSVAAADGVQLYEKKIQSGLIYNFLKYTEWPKTIGSEDTPFRVCIFGESDPFEGHLNPISGRTAQQRKILLQYISTPNNIGDCHLLVVDSRESGKMLQLLGYLKDKSILTISDMEGFAKAGGMIEFAKKNGHIAVNINKSAVDDAHLKINDRMLSLAEVVQ